MQLTSYLAAAILATATTVMSVPIAASNDGVSAYMHAGQIYAAAGTIHARNDDLESGDNTLYRRTAAPAVPIVRAPRRSSSSSRQEHSPARETETQSQSQGRNLSPPPNGGRQGTMLRPAPPQRQGSYAGGSHNSQTQQTDGGNGEGPSSPRSHQALPQLQTNDLPPRTHSFVNGHLQQTELPPDSGYETDPERSWTGNDFVDSP